MHTTIAFPDEGKQIMPYGPDRLWAAGRNGVIQCRGVALTALPQHLVLRAVTSRGPTGACWLELPRDPGTLYALASLIAEAARATKANPPGEPC